MKYWTRTTHNFNNDTREWEFKRDQIPDHWIGRSTLGIHALTSGRWQTLYEIVQQNTEYYEQYKDDPFGGCHETGHSKESVLYDLEQMEKLGMVKSKEV